MTAEEEANEEGRRPEEAVSGRIMSSRNYVAKDICLGIRPQAAMLEGVFEVAQAVRVTMGPRWTTHVSKRKSSNIFIHMKQLIGVHMDSL
ncbi:hypothetical protein F2Q69_00010012 [Brassica cretica]|uniref:Uncharacterized protein n=1 Tax=Brassica cretica TaxID=69181 RepID=A0A8S9NSS6_BRACR|nr:hypothetical protein F2Q69_00010012 [Brassica cretica]